MTSKMKASRKLTLMVVWVGVIFLLGNVPYLVGYILRKIFPSNDLLNFVSDITRIFMALSNGSNLFIYFYFNNLFRKILIHYVSFIFCFKKRTANNFASYYSSINL